MVQGIKSLGVCTAYLHSDPCAWITIQTPLHDVQQVWIRNGGKGNCVGGIGYRMHLLDERQMRKWSVSVDNLIQDTSQAPDI